jgi:hypothetical protein
MKHLHLIIVLLAILSAHSESSWAWHDETHAMIAKAAGYPKWFNAAGADMIKIKAGWIEKKNHYVNNPRGAVVTADMVLAQTDHYDGQKDPTGHLYGAIIGSIRNYIKVRQAGKYAEYHLAFAVHYIGDLSQPLHNTLYNDYNRTNHIKTDGIVNDDIMANMNRIKIYEIAIETERDLAREIARIANLSMTLGYKLEDERRLLTKQEAYHQISHSASLVKAVLAYVAK